MSRFQKPKDEDYLYKKLEENFQKESKFSQDDQIKKALAERRKKLDEGSVK